MFNNVLRQLIVTRTALASEGIEPTHAIDDITIANRYLWRVSSTQVPSALANMHGLGLSPSPLYRCVAFDKIHCFDLDDGLLVYDFSDVEFETSLYNMGFMSKPAFVRIDNQRFADFYCPHNVYVQLFCMEGSEVHENMTGTIRRNIIPFF